MNCAPGNVGSMRRGVKNSRQADERAYKLHDVIVIIVIVIQKVVFVIVHGGKVDTVAQDTTDTTKTLDELGAFLGTIRDKIELTT